MTASSSSGTGAAHPARFVVGTGRCGSTLLTRLLDQHSDVTGLHEVFTGLDWDRRFVAGPVSGEYMVDLLATPNPVIAEVVGAGHDAEEVTYPFRASDRYRRGDPLPWILTSTLGHLSADPDEYWDRLSDWLVARPGAGVTEHYRALFDRLADDQGANLWVERSGSSIDYVGELARVFPDARFVHLHREGPEVALSMRAHPFYRLAVQLLYGPTPPERPDDPRSELARRLDAPTELAWFGRYWSDQLANGERGLADVASDRVLNVSFEHLIQHTTEVLLEITNHLDLPPDSGFAARAEGMVRRPVDTRADRLEPTEAEVLDAACAPGREVLDRLVPGFPAR